MNLFTGYLESKDTAYLYLLITIKDNVTWLFVPVNVHSLYFVHSLRQFYEGGFFFFKKTQTSKKKKKARKVFNCFLLFTAIHKKITYLDYKSTKIRLLALADCSFLGNVSASCYVFCH